MHRWRVRPLAPLALALASVACAEARTDTASDAGPSPDRPTALDVVAVDTNPLDSAALDSGAIDAVAVDTSAVDAAIDVPPSDAPSVTVLRVHYPVGARALSLRGSLAGLSWERGVAFTRVDANTYEWRSASVAMPFEWKPLLDDADWSRGPNYTARPGDTVDVYPRFATAIGRWSRAIPAFSSAVLGNARGVWVYLPPSYDENPLRRFPVLYMHDGQNLFDPAAAFGGVTWRVHDAMNLGAEDGSIREAIVVGPENTAARIDEYTPTVDAEHMAGGRGDLYLRMLVEELKPLIDRTYRTLPDRANTALMGSSLGGLISVYAGVTRAETFGAIGAMSPSTWWDDRMILGRVPALATLSPRPERVYVDSGDSGASSDDVANTRELAAALRTAGYRDGSTLRYVVEAGGQHSERYWAARLPDALRFLRGPRAE
ncbi:MAG: alpha/beta hydrolase-fold protein [Polyangiales bacterium]